MLPSGSKKEDAESQDYPKKAAEGLGAEGRRLQVDVNFSGLSYEVEVPVEDPGVHTFLTAGAELLNGLTCNSLGKSKKKKQKIILDDVSGVLKPGTSTLVMGPRGAGISTLFKALSGRLGKNRNLKGEITYSGVSKADVDPRRFSTYVDQNDLHIPTLTVRETLEFAAKCFGTAGNDISSDDIVNSILHQMGLEKCENTLIGNEMIRGISGGEKRRVSTAEMLCGRKPLMFFDQLSTGLDSSTAFKIIQDLINQAREKNFTYVFSLLQPSPELFSLFDEIIIMAEGKFVFQGSPDDVLPFFASVGYTCPNHIDVTDFIQEVTTDLRFNFETESENEVMKSIAEIAQAYSKSEFRAMSGSTEIFSGANLMSGNKINISFRNDLELLFGRQFKLLYRNKPFIGLKIAQSFILGLLIGTVFYDLDPDLSNLANVQQRYSIIFNLLILMITVGFGFVPNVLDSRAIFYKQSNCSFHRTLTFVAASSLVTVPLQFLECLILASLTFWLSAVVPLDHEEVFMCFLGTLFILFLLNLVLVSFFQFVGNISPKVETGLTVAGLLAATMILFSGFIITNDNIPPWFIWIYWLNPIAYSFKAVMIINMRSSGFSALESNFAFALYSFPDDSYFVAVAVAFLGFCFVANVLLNIFALSYVRHENIERKREVQEKKNVSTKEVGELLEDTKFKSGSLIFKNIGYTIRKSSENDLVLLQDVSGYAFPGSMTALMGASGAGKTTLLDVLANRKTQGTIDGEIYINGKPINSSFAQMMGYVEQMDVHSPYQTVEESIYFSAILRQPKSAAKADVDELVASILQTLELEGIRDFIVGEKDIGELTNDEAKRLTIGVELAANPSIIFLDEPTTGLDSRAAQIIMRSLKRVAQSGRTIICTIHQPNRTVFELFDKALVLQAGGRTVYFGDLGNNSEVLVEYIEALPGSMKIPNLKYNPAEYMLQVFGKGTTKDESVKKHDIKETFATDYQNEIKQNFVTDYENSSLNMENNKTIDESLRSFEDEPFEKPLGLGKSFWTQQKILIWKVFSTYWRYTTYTFVRQLFLIIISLLWGFTFFKVADTSNDFNLTNVLSIMGIFLNSIMFMGSAAGAFGIAAVMHEKAPFIREKSSKFYGVLPYTIAWTLVELVYIFLGTLVFAITVLFMIGLKPSAEVLFKWWLPFFLSFTGFTFIGQFFMIILPKMDSASMAVSLVECVAAIFAGFFIAIEDITPFWQWLSYVFHVSYALNAMSSSIFSCKCSTFQVLEGACETGNEFGCTIIQTPDSTNLTSWDTLVEIYGFDDSKYWEDILVLVLFIIVYRVVAYFAYLRLKPSR